jgi:hypothetical protein
MDWMKLLSLHWAHSAALAEDGWIRMASNAINGRCGIFMTDRRIIEESGFVNIASRQSRKTNYCQLSGKRTVV